jgi:hypothetical protein
MAITNAEKQQRWRKKRNARAGALDPALAPKDAAEAIFRELGADRARKIVPLLARRVRNLKPDCPACKGTGLAQIKLFSCSGEAEGDWTVPCDCDPKGVAGLPKLGPDGRLPKGPAR